MFNIDLKKWYWAFISIFAGAVTVGMAAHGAAPEDPMSYMEPISRTVEMVGDHVGYLHEDNGVMVASSGAAMTKEVKEKVDELYSNMKDILQKEDDIDDARDAASNAKEKVEKLSERNAELVDEIKEAREDMKSLQDHVDDLDVKIQERGGSASPKSIGKEVADDIVEDVEAKNYVDNPPAGENFQTEVKDVGIKDITNAGGSAGDVVDPDFQEQIIPDPILRQVRIINLLPVIETSSDTVEWVQQTSETDNAGPQSGQGSTLSQSDMEFTLQTDPVETIGHIAKSSVQILNDAPRLRDFVNNRMVRLLELELEDQMLLGDGTSNNLNGLVPNAAAYYSNLESAVTDTPVTDIDRVATMLLQTQRNNYAPTGIVLNPTNWWGTVLTKDNDDNYQFANAQSMATPRLWGFPVVVSNSMPEGEALAGDFQRAATFYDRRSTVFEISTENASDFENLMVTMRAYLRGMLAFEKTNAIVHNDNMDTTAPAGS